MEIRKSIAENKAIRARKPVARNCSFIQQVFAVVIGILIVMLMSCSFHSIINEENINKAMSGLYIIHTEGSVDFDGIIKPREVNAISFYIGNKHIIALTHATKIPEVMQIRTPFGIFSSPVRVISEKHTINGKEVKLVGRYEDISIFKTDIIGPSPFTFGDSDNLKIGTFLIVPGYSFAKAFNVKTGIVSRTDLTDRIYGEESKECFLMTTPINPGDSGSPILAELFGKYRVVGIANATIQDKGMGFALKSNYIQMAIKKILS